MCELFRVRMLAHRRLKTWRQTWLTCGERMRCVPIPCLSCSLLWHALLQAAALLKVLCSMSGCVPPPAIGGSWRFAAHSAVFHERLSPPAIGAPELQLSIRQEEGNCNQNLILCFCCAVGRFLLCSALLCVCVCVCGTTLCCRSPLGGTCSKAHIFVGWLWKLASETGFDN
jgi:hypothetical protein